MRSNEYIFIVWLFTWLLYSVCWDFLLLFGIFSNFIFMFEKLILKNYLCSSKLLDYIHLKDKIQKVIRNKYLLDTTLVLIFILSIATILNSTNSSLVNHRF